MLAEWLASDVFDAQECPRDDRVHHNRGAMMSSPLRLILAALLVTAIVWPPDAAFAGMPSLLPSEWTANCGPAETEVVPASYRWQVQTLSFFRVTFLIGTKAVAAGHSSRRRTSSGCSRGWGRTTPVCARSRSG